MNVPQDYSRTAKPGLVADLTFPDLPGKRIPAKLVSTSDAIDPSSRTLLVQFEVDNSNGELLPGAYAALHLKLPAGSSSYIVPATSLMFRSEGLRLATVNDNKAALLPVTIGRDFGTEVEIISGLTGNESIIVNPHGFAAARPAGTHRTELRRGYQVRSAPAALPNRLRVASLLAFVLLMGACTVGPKYQRPPVAAPPEYKETGQWKTALPSDQIAKGKWWEIYQDPQLNALEEQISVSNQTLKASQAQYAQARALVRFTRASYFPTVTANPNINRVHLSQHRPLGSTTNGTSYNDLILPMDVSYEVDLWGRIRHTVEQSRENAQASAADLENVSLSLHAELAVDYFLMRSLDAEQQLLNSTVTAFQKALELTQNRYKGGVASQVDVAQAQTQLETTRALAIDDELSRAQFEHAIAVLVGKPPATFSLPANPLNAPPPIIPPGLPSDLLERRPDIASFERQMASANAGIGIAKAAYYPILNLGASGGFESATWGLLLNGSSGFWSVGASAVSNRF